MRGDDRKQQVLVSVFIYNMIDYKGFLCVWVLLAMVQSIGVKLVKRNVMVPSGEQYISLVNVSKENAELIPTNLSLSSQVVNTIPSMGNNFDYFNYLIEKDISCYRQSVNNQSYLFPCPFVDSAHAQLRTTSAFNKKQNQEIEDISTLGYWFVVDNSPFPYPQGAYSYSDINIDVSVSLHINISSSYEVLGRRLIFINSTVFFIFAVIIFVLICKTNRINNKMQHSKSDASPNSVLTLLEQEEEEDNDSFIDEQDDPRPQRIRDPLLESRSENTNNEHMAIQRLSSRMEEH